MNYVIVMSILFVVKIEVNAFNMRASLFSRRQLSNTNGRPATNLALQHHITVLPKQCYVKNELKECPAYPTATILNNAETKINSGISQEHPQNNFNTDVEHAAQTNLNINYSPFRRMIDQIIDSNMIPLHGKLDGYLSQISEKLIPSTVSSKLNLKLGSLLTKNSEVVQATTVLPHSAKPLLVNSSKENSTIDAQIVTVDYSSHDVSASEKFVQSLDRFERKFYATTFSKLSSISSASRRENGMSYVQSGLFLQLALMALSTEVGPETRREIDECLELDISDQERLELINATVSSLPVSSDDLKFRWSSRLVLRSQNVSERFLADAAPALRLQIDNFNVTETPKEMADALNLMVETDSGGAIHNTFEEEELSGDIKAVLVNTLYIRARWRSAPTLLNGTHAFNEAGGPRRAARMIRLNDNMRYARLDHWDAEALEIFYSTPGLSVVLLVPRGGSLRRLAGAAAGAGPGAALASLRPQRVAATLPLYTLRMTLLLPNKLQAMNISRLVAAAEGGGELRLSLAVQRIMFWAEAGRNAFKDDGLEWDEPPERELIVDRPYIFYVRWKNKTIMNGNFVL